MIGPHFEWRKLLLPLHLGWQGSAPCSYLQLRLRGWSGQLRGQDGDLGYLGFSLTAQIDPASEMVTFFASPFQTESRELSILTLCDWLSFSLTLLPCDSFRVVSFLARWELWTLICETLKLGKWIWLTVIFMVGWDHASSKSPNGQLIDFKLVAF